MKTTLLFLVSLSLLIFACEAPPGDDSGVSEETLQATVDTFVMMWNTGDMDMLRASTTEDFTRVTNGETDAGNQEEMGEIVNNFRTAYPDGKVTLGDTYYHDGKVFTHWTFTGTNTGPMNEMPPTGKAVEVNGFSVVHFNDDGKAMKEYVFFNQLAQMQQMGYTLTPPAAEDEGEGEMEE